jgi:hypothetical protein
MSRTVLDEPASPCFPFAPRIHSDPIGFGSSDIIEALSSPEDGIKKNLTIDMKDLVGDAVGNVRSPYPIIFLSHPNLDEHQSLVP